MTIDYTIYGKEINTIKHQIVYGDKHSEIRENLVSETFEDYSYQWKETVLDNVIIDEIEVLLKTDLLKISVLGDDPVYKLHFEIEGGLDANLKNDSALVVPSGHYNFYYLPQEKTEIHNSYTRRKTLEIRFSEQYLFDILNEKVGKVWTDFKTCVTEQRAFLLFKYSRPISFEMRNLLFQITQSNIDGQLKKIYLEAKVKELIALVLCEKSILSTNKAEVTEQLEESYLLMREAANILLSTLRKPPTTEELAQMLGINSTKLKKEFKKVLGESIFQYITNRRMESALELLQVKKMSVSQTAYEVGYKNPQHFTVAFKKKYAKLPKEYCK